MKLSVITLSWDNIDYTKAFVKSIRGNTSLHYELIIVDNGSETKTQKWIEENADKSLLFSENQGFSKGFNEGLRISQGEYVMMANNDTEFPPDWDIKLVETFENYPKAGIVSPVYTSGRKSALRYKVGKKIIKIFPFRKYPSAVAFFMKREELINKFGGWPEEYKIASGEDADLCFKVWKAGYKILIDERVLIHHEGKITSTSKLDDWQKHFRINSRQFKKKWFYYFYFPYLAAFTENIRRLKIYE